MANQEGAGQGLLGIIAPQRERTATPVLPKPDVKPAPVSPEPKRRKGLSRKARIALAGLAVVGAGAGAYEGYQNIPAVHQAVDSAFLDHIRGKTLSSEASTINPEGLFDNTATRGVITEKNTIQITREEYAKIAPASITKEAPEELNILFPIKFAEGSANRTLRIKRGTDYMGGGIRKVSGDNTQFQLMNSLTIEDGLQDGDMLIAPVSGTISSGLTIAGEDRAGNTYGIMLVGIFTSSKSANFKLIKDIHPSKTEEFEPGKFRTIESYVPIEQGEVIGIIQKPSKGPLGMGGAGGIGQFQMLTFSTVTGKDGTKQVGAAGSKINTSPDGKIYTIN